jgi:hypothetical protein
MRKSKCAVPNEEHKLSFSGATLVKTIGRESDFDSPLNPFDRADVPSVVETTALGSRIWLEPSQQR